MYSAFEQAQCLTTNVPTTEYIYSVAVVQQKGHDPLVVMSVDDLTRLAPRLSSDTANDNGGNGKWYGKTVLNAQQRLT